MFYHILAMYFIDIVVPQGLMYFTHDLDYFQILQVVMLKM